MSMNVATDRVKEVVRLGSGQAKAVEPVPQATNLSKRYCSVTVLAQITLEILPGEMHAIIGENGWRRMGPLLRGGRGDASGTV